MKINCFRFIHFLSVFVFVFSFSLFTNDSMIYASSEILIKDHNNISTTSEAGIIIEEDSLNSYDVIIGEFQNDVDFEDDDSRQIRSFAPRNVRIRLVSHYNSGLDIYVELSANSFRSPRFTEMDIT